MNILKKLSGRDLRSIGKSNEVVKDISKNPSLFREVFDGILQNDPIIKLRSADVIEKVSSRYPRYLQPFKNKLINDISKIKQQEVRWHVAQMFSYLKVNKKERDKIIRILYSWLNSEKSNIVRVCCMQTLAEFAKKDFKIMPKILKKLKDAIKLGSPAIKSRGKRLINELTLIQKCRHSKINKLLEEDNV